MGLEQDLFKNRENSGNENPKVIFESFSGLTNIQNPANRQKVEEYKEDLYSQFSKLDKENYLKVKGLYDEASDEELVALYNKTFLEGVQSLGDLKNNREQKIKYYRDLSEKLQNTKFISKEGLHAAGLFEMKNNGNPSFREEFMKLYREQSALESKYEKITSTQEEESTGFNENAELANLSQELDSENVGSVSNFQKKILQQIFDYSQKHLETIGKLLYTPMDVPDYKDDFFSFITSQPKDGFIGKLGELYKKAYLKTLKRSPNFEQINKLEVQLKSIKSQIIEETQKLPANMNTNPIIQNLIKKRDTLIESINRLGNKILSEGDGHGVSQEEISKMFL